MVMKIIDINGTERTIKDNLKIVTHVRKNESGKVFHENIDGELVTKKEMSETEVEEKYVEVEVVGKRGREWKEWYRLEDFEKLNPSIEV